MARSVKQTLNSWLNYSSPKLGTFLAKTWKNQQQALTYKEIREAIQNGQLDISYLKQWQQDYSKFIINAYAPLAQQAIDNSVKAIASQFGIGAKILQNPYIDNFIGTRGGKLIREVTQEQFKAINVLVRQAALSDTMSIQELAKAIRPTIGLTQRQTQATYNFYDHAKQQALKDGKTEAQAQEIALKKQAAYAEHLHRTRADTIAITEMAYAYNWGKQAYMKQSIADGLIGGCQTQWSTADDERVCDECGPMDGVVTEIDDDFVTTVPKKGGAHTIHGPVVPPMHPRCRCVVNYINVLPPTDWVDTPQEPPQEPDYEPEIPEDFDWSKDGLDYLGEAHLGGTGKMYRMGDPVTGDEYLFKPAQQKYSNTTEPFRAYVQEAGYKVQGIIDADSAVVVGTGYVDLPVGGTTFGAAQMRIQNVDSTFDLKSWQYNGGPLDPNVVAQLQRENVTDWLLCNYDSHGGNFILTTDGKLIGVDKEQSFRFIGQTGAQTMSLNFHPNSAYGEAEPIYNTLYRRFANGEIDINLNDTLAYIKRIEAIPDTQYREIFRPYAEALYGAGKKAENLLDQILARKQNVRATFESFYGELMTQRKGTPTTFQFADTGTPLVPSPATKLFSPETLKGMKLSELHEIAKAQGFKNFGIMHKDELIDIISDPSKYQQIHDTATERARQIGAERKARKLGQQTQNGMRTLEGVPQISDAIKDPEAALANATPRGVALIGDTTALEGMEATLRKVSIDGEEYYELTGKMTQTRWEQALNHMNGASSGRYWRYNEAVGAIDYTQPVLNLTATTEQISLGTRYFRNGDDIIIIAGTDATRDSRALMGQFNIRVKAGPDAAARMQQLINQAGIQDVTADATKDALDRYKKMRVIWQHDPATARTLDASTASDAQIDTALRKLGITQSRLDSIKLKKVQDGYWTLVDPENVALANQHGAAYIYHEAKRIEDAINVVKSGELLATTNRFNTGIFKKGASSFSDIESGGADGVFTRIVYKQNIGNEDRYKHFGNFVFVFDTKTLERTDWYAYTSDEFGSTKDYIWKYRPGAADFFSQTSSTYHKSNEIMFRRTLPLTTLTEIRVPAADRQPLIDRLKRDGIREINGIRIEDIIKIGGSLV